MEDRGTYAQTNPINEIEKIRARKAITIEEHLDRNKLMNYQPAN